MITSSNIKNLKNWSKSTTSKWNTSLFIRLKKTTSRNDLIERSYKWFDQCWFESNCLSSFETKRYALLIISKIWCQRNKTKKNHRTNCEQTINQTLIIWKNLSVWFMFTYQQRNEINLISFHFREFSWIIIRTFKWKFLIRWRKKFNDIQL